MVQVPASVQLLKTQADFFVELHNAGGEHVQIVDPIGMDWSTFSEPWYSLCEADDEIKAVG